MGERSLCRETITQFLRLNINQSFAMQNYNKLLFKSNIAGLYSTKIEPHVTKDTLQFKSVATAPTFLGERPLHTFFKYFHSIKYYLFKK